MPRQLTGADVAAFHRDGFLLVRGLADAATVAALDAETEPLHERMAGLAPATSTTGGARVAWEDQQQPGRPRRIRQLMNSEDVCPTIEQVLASDAMLDIVAQLMPSPAGIALYHSKLLMKSGVDGSFTPFHQDWGYWNPRFKQPTHLNCMLAIDPMTEANGCIRFVRGSHTAGFREHVTVESASFSLAISGSLDAFPEAVPVECAAGDAVFFGPLVVHGSMPNESAGDRRANTFAYDIPGNLIIHKGAADSGQVRVLRSAAAAAL